MLRNRVLLLTVATFVVLGMPRAALGVAWPDVSAGLGRPLAELGLVVAVIGAAYAAAGIGSSRLTRRIGPGPALVLAALVTAGGVLVLAVAAGLPSLLGASVLIGSGSAFIDTLVNAHVTLQLGPRGLGPLHAGFGLGATAGPGLMAGLLAGGLSWRLGFVTFAVLQGMIAGWLFARKQEFARPQNPVVDSLPPGWQPRRRVVAGSLAAFFVLAALEVATGQWAYSMLTEGRDFGVGAAGVAITLYFAAYTGARLLLGPLAERFGPGRVLRHAVLVTIVGLSLFWVSPHPVGTALGLAVAGFALGPVFPLQMALTPHRVGTAGTPAMVGYQIGAANIGAIVLGGGMGLVVAEAGVLAVAPVLVATAAVGLVIVAALDRVTGR